MTEFIELVKQNPALFLIIGGVVLILVLIIIFQGRSIKTPWGEIGAKHEKSDQFSPQSDSVTQSLTFTQSPSVTQNPTLNIYSGASLSMDQMEEFAERVARKVEGIRREFNNQPPSYLYEPTILSDRINNILSVRYDIESKIQNIAIGWGGHWMGSSMASFDTFFGLSQTHGLISSQLASDITDFYFYTQRLLNSGDVMDEQYLEIQYLAAKINKELDFYYRKIEEDPNSYIAQERRYLTEHEEDSIG